MRNAVNYLVKRIPLISNEARDPDFAKHFPFVVDNSDRYWKLDYAKRRNIEVIYLFFILLERSLFSTTYTN